MSSTSTASAVKKRTFNGLEIKYPVKNVVLVDATSECFEPFEGRKDLEFFPVLVNPSDNVDGFSKLHQALENLNPEETIVLTDGWFNRTACGKIADSYSEVALSYYNEATNLGYPAEIFLGWSDSPKACSLAATEALSAYI